MANWHGYLGIEDLDLTVEQRETLIDWFKTFGQAENSPFPNFRLQTRKRLDNKAVIFEAVFKEDWLSVDFVTNKLAQVFGVDPATITTTTVQSPYGPAVTFSRPAASARLRMLLFAGVNSDWESSRLATVSYLSANQNDWESELP